MTYVTGKKGTVYHWLLVLFRQLKPPILDGMQEALEQANKNRKKKLEKLKRAGEWVFSGTFPTVW